MRGMVWSPVDIRGQSTELVMSVGFIGSGSKDGYGYDGPAEVPACDSLQQGGG